MYKPKAKYHSHNVLPLKTSKGLSDSVETNCPAIEAWAESFLSPPSGSSIMDGAYTQVSPLIYLDTQYK